MRERVGRSRDERVEPPALRVTAEKPRPVGDGAHPQRADQGDAAMTAKVRPRVRGNRPSPSSPAMVVSTGVGTRASRTGPLPASELVGTRIGIGEPNAGAERPCRPS